MVSSVHPLNLSCINRTVSHGNGSISIDTSQFCSAHVPHSISNSLQMTVLDHSKSDDVCVSSQSQYFSSVIDFLFPLVCPYWYHFNFIQSFQSISTVSLSAFSISISYFLVT